MTSRRSARTTRSRSNPSWPTRSRCCAARPRCCTVRTPSGGWSTYVPTGYRSTRRRPGVVAPWCRSTVPLASVTPRAGSTGPRGTRAGASTWTRSTGAARTTRFPASWRPIPNPARSSPAPWSTVRSTTRAVPWVRAGLANAGEPGWHGPGTRRTTAFRAPAISTTKRWMRGRMRRRKKSSSPSTSARSGWMARCTPPIRSAALRTSSGC